MLLEGGRTAHSRLKIPIPITKTSYCGITRKNAIGKLIKDAKVILWDEAPMAHKWQIEALDRSLKFLMDNDKPFGGKKIILLGDFRQTLTIIPGAGPSQIINSTIHHSHLWQYFKIMYLTINQRILLKKNKSNQNIMEKWAEFLLDIGNNAYEIEYNLGENLIKLPNNIISNTTNINEFFNEIYQNLEDNLSNCKYFYEKIILTTLNKDVNDINAIGINKFPGEMQTFKSVDSPLQGDECIYTTEYLNSITPNGLPPHELHLKIGIPIILLRNINSNIGACNGRRLKIIALNKYIIEAQTIDGTDIIYSIPRIPMQPSDSRIVFIRRQFPIRVAFCITINKSQGQTLQNIGLYLPTPVFSHGQLYVALSRVSLPSDISVYVETVKQSFTQGKFKGFNGTYTRNIVWSEALNNNILSEETQKKKEKNAQKLLLKQLKYKSNLTIPIVYDSDSAIQDLNFEPSIEYYDEEHLEPIKKKQKTQKNKNKNKYIKKKQLNSNEQVRIAKNKEAETNGIIVDCGGEGNCFFYCAAVELYGDRNKHFIIRRNACEHILRHKQFYSTGFESMNDFYQYVYNMKRNGTDADGLIINATQEVYNVWFDIKRVYINGYKQSNEKVSVNVPIIYLFNIVADQYYHYQLIKKQNNQISRPDLQLYVQRQLSNQNNNIPQILYERLHAIHPLLLRNL